MSRPTIASAEQANNNSKADEQQHEIAVIASEYKRVERLFNPSSANTTTTTTTTTKSINHVLLVGRGGKRGNNNVTTTTTLSKNDVDSNIEDYLSRRHEFQKMSQQQQQQQQAASTGIKNDHPGTVVDHTTTTTTTTNDGSKDGMMILREMTSQLEMAMITCCERVLIPTEDVVHRSRIIPVHVLPVLPANWLGDEDDNELPGVAVVEVEVKVKKLEQSSKGESSSSSSSPRNKLSQLVAANNNKMGILRIDKSMHFVKLLVMNCYDVSHRAMALAILQRTIEMEISTIIHPQVNKNSIPKLFIVNNSTDNDDDGGEQRIINIIGLLNTELKQNFSMNATRIKSFLAAGGMRLLAQWLKDAYTVVSPSFPPINPIKGSPAQQQQQQGNDQYIASPTGCLLLPLLHLLKFIPFDKKIVIESQIHKYIKRLKKSLSALVENDDADTTILDNIMVHPISGGLSVRKVIASIDTVMSVWKRAAASPLFDNDHPTSYMFDELQTRVKHRFDILEQMQSKAGNPAWYMGKSINSSARSFIPNSAISKLGLVRQNSFPPAVKSMEEDKGASKKREGSPTVFESSKNPNKKHISWAPLPIKGED